MNFLLAFALNSHAAEPARPHCTCALLATRKATNYGRVALVREFFRGDGSLAFSEQVDAFSWGEDTIAVNAQLRHLVGFFPTQELASTRCERARASQLDAGLCQ